MEPLVKDTLQLTKDIHVIKDTYQSHNYPVRAIFYPWKEDTSFLEDQKYCPIGVRLIEAPLYDII